MGKYNLIYIKYLFIKIDYPISIIGAIFNATTSESNENNAKKRDLP